MVVSVSKSIFSWERSHIYIYILPAGTFFLDDFPNFPKFKAPTNTTSWWVENILISLDKRSKIYCWWKKSCKSWTKSQEKTTWDGANTRRFIIGFQLPDLPQLVSDNRISEPSTLHLQTNCWEISRNFPEKHALLGGSTGRASTFKRLDFNKPASKNHRTFGIHPSMSKWYLYWQVDNPKGKMQGSIFQSATSFGLFQQLICEMLPLPILNAFVNLVLPSFIKVQLVSSNHLSIRWHISEYSNNKSLSCFDEKLHTQCFFVYFLPSSRGEWLVSVWL